MALSKSSEKLLIEMYKHEDNVVEYLGGLFKEADSKEDAKLRSRLKELRENGMVNTHWADNVPYIAQLTHVAEDYLEENDLMIKEFNSEILRAILNELKTKHDFANVLIYMVGSCGRSQIGWRQADEHEWDIKLEANDMVKVKTTGRELEENLKEYGYILAGKTDDDSKPRYKLYLKFKHKSLISKETEVSHHAPGLRFDAFINDFLSSCLELQSNKPSVEGSEDDKTVFIRSQLTARKYDALDQTLMGKSAGGKQSGEVDLLIRNHDKTPFCIIEALCLKSVDTTNIDSHINKITKYDANGMMWNIVLSFVETADFGSFVERYIGYVKDADFEYPISNIKDFSNPQFSEIRVFSSQFNRSDIDRELTHVLLKMPD